MVAIGSLTKHAVLAKLMHREDPISRNKKIGINFVFITGFFVVLAFLFLLYGAFLHIDRLYGIEMAFYFIGCASLVIAALNALIAYCYYRFKRRQMEKLKDELIALFEESMDYLNEEVAEPVKEHPTSSVAIATTLGYLAGERFL